MDLYVCCAVASGSCRGRCDSALVPVGNSVLAGLLISRSNSGLLISLEPRDLGVLSLSRPGLMLDLLVPETGYLAIMKRRS